MRQAKRRQRTVALDKPCSECGKPIHHAYVGPIAGVCGRCTDRRKRKRVRTRRVGRIETGSAPGSRSATANLALIVLVMVAGAAAIMFALDLVFG